MHARLIWGIARPWFCLSIGGWLFSTNAITIWFYGSGAIVVVVLKASYTAFLVLAHIVTSIHDYRQLVTWIWVFIFILARPWFFVDYFVSC